MVKDKRIQIIVVAILLLVSVGCRSRQQAKTPSHVSKWELSNGETVEVQLISEGKSVCLWKAADGGVIDRRLIRVANPTSLTLLDNGDRAILIEPIRGNNARKLPLRGQDWSDRLVADCVAVSFELGGSKCADRWTDLAATQRDGAELARQLPDHVRQSLLQDIVAVQLDKNGERIACASQLPNLRILISMRILSQEDLTVLAKISTLRECRFDVSQMRDQDVAALEVLTQIEGLLLPPNVSQSAVDLLRERIPNTNIVTSDSGYGSI